MCEGFLDNANLLCKFSKVDNNVNQLSLAEVFEDAIHVEYMINNNLECGTANVKSF